MLNRRQMLTRSFGGAALASSRPEAIAEALAAAGGLGTRTAEEVAQDEDFWFTVRQCYGVHPTLINLNNGGVAPAPQAVMDAMKRALDWSNIATAHTMWRDLEPGIERARRDLAKMFGCDVEEMAITRNASEALETVILGLQLKAGDEVIATDQNYPRMATAWRQRERRDGIAFKTISVPAPPKNQGDLLAAFENAIGPKTRVIEVCHITNLTGQIYPVREIIEAMRPRGIEVVVDGAHAFACFPFLRDDLGCDYYGTSLHKWLGAPVGTGFLYVRKSKIKSVWPLFAAPEELDDDIRKFEEIGTHPAANHHAIGEAVAFNLGIGIERKAARLRHLRKRWTDRFKDRSNARVLTPDDPAQACAIGMISIDGLPPRKLAKHLLEKHGIITAAILHEDFEGLRITPNVYTTAREIDTFSEVLDRVLKEGIKEEPEPKDARKRKPAPK
jgi:selenocysteine lyase/cysteine desulfurase